MRYDDRLKTYVLSCEELGQFSISYLNNFPHKLIIEYPSTKKLSIDLVRKINNSRIGFKIIGGFDKKRTAYWNEENKKDPTNRPGRFNIPGVSYMEDCNIYNISEMSQILTKIESIEKCIMPEWSDIKKALYVYDRLREEIIYDPEYEIKESREIRSLRGLISGKTVCAGYSLIFKEFMDRLGIECDFVQGNTKATESNRRSGHCWNILYIDGKLFPVDLTWDAGEYRAGNSDSFSNFSYLRKFRQSHFPLFLEREQDYSKLHGLKREFVERTINSFKRQKEFSESVISIDTIDGERVYVTQLERIDCTTDDKNRVYRYVVARKDKDGMFVDYRMVYASTNLLKVRKALEWKKINRNSCFVNGVSELFSYRNIEKARRNGTSYIGKIEEVADGHNYVITSKKRLRSQYPDMSKEFKRRDGSYYLVAEDAKRNVIDRQSVTSGFIGSFTANGYREYKVFSDKSLFDKSVRGLETGFFDEGFLQTRVRYAGGYLGYLNEYGRCTTTESLARYFDIKNCGDFVSDDIISSENVSNDRYVANLSLTTLREAISEYDLEYSSDFSKCWVVERETGEKVNDPKTDAIAKFAHVWQSAAGSKMLTNEEYPGITYAFNEGSSRVYDFVVDNCCRMLEETGRINFDRLNSTELERQGYSPYKYEMEIFSSLTRHPGNRKALFDFCNMQVEVYRNSNISERARVFEDRKINGDLQSMFDNVSSTNRQNLGQNGMKM